MDSIDDTARCPNCASSDIVQFESLDPGFSFGCFGCLGGLPLLFFWPLRRRRRRTQTVARCRTCGHQWRASGPALDR